MEEPLELIEEARQVEQRAREAGHEGAVSRTHQAVRQAHRGWLRRARWNIEQADRDVATLRARVNATQEG